MLASDGAQESGIETPTAEDLIRMDRNRTGKRLSNEEWVSETDPEARIARMQDGTTHLAYKPEHAIDLDTGAVVAAEMHPCLGVGLQAEAEIVQQRADQGAADPVALGLQLVGEPAQALAGPAQRRFRIAARGRLDQGLESRPQPADRSRPRTCGPRPADAAGPAAAGSGRPGPSPRPMVLGAKPVT